MALEAVIYQQDLFGQSSRDVYGLYSLVQTGNCDDFESDPIRIADESSYASLENYLDFEAHPHPHQQAALVEDANTAVSVRGKRRRSRVKKNVEEIETQRMTHIATERNRRKQMNEYLSVLRSIMPDSYVLKGDQASIVGGAINYVKELEQQLQLLSGQKEDHENDQLRPFGELFNCPQYSTESETAEADIQVTMVETHANLKIRSTKKPKRLLKLVSGLQNQRLTILHLNVTTVDQLVLYSLSLKVEDGSNLTSVDEIAAAVNQILLS